MPSNVGRIFKQDNVNTETLDLLTEKLGINLYRYLANVWDEIANDDPSFKFKDPQGEFFRHVPKLGPEVPDKPKISILIEVDPEKHSEIFKILQL